MPQARVAFQYPSFRYFMIARYLTTAASEMQSVAVAWQVYSLTKRPLDLGLVGLAQFLPGMLLQPETGTDSVRGADKAASSLAHAVQICLYLQREPTPT